MNPAILPQPQHVQWTEGTCSMPSLEWRMHPETAKAPCIEQKLVNLGITVNLDASLPVNTLLGGTAFPPSAAGNMPALPMHDPRLHEGDSERSTSAPDRTEGYALSITPESLAVAGCDTAGLLWGLTTLDMLVEQTDPLPCVRIEDWPEVPMRGHQDDISRKQVSTLEDFKRIIRFLSRFKINHYLPYMEDMLYLPSHPDIGEGRGRLTHEEVRAMVEEGERYGVEIIPVFSLIGHQENLLKMETYKHLGAKIFHPMSSLDPAKPEVRAFLKDIIPEVCALFPSRYFHMAFDETQGVAKEAFLEHANWCAERLTEQGKTPIMWVDMIYHRFGYEAIRRLHPAIIPVNWQYKNVEGPVPHQEELVAQGRPVWGLAGYFNWRNFLAPSTHWFHRHMENWMDALRQTRSPSLMCSQWGDEGYENSRDLCRHLFALYGEHAWSGAAADTETAHRRFQRIHYGAELPGIQAVFDQLPDQLSLDSREIWTLHRQPPELFIRRAAHHPDEADIIQHDIEQLDQALEALRADREAAVKEQNHLDHIEVGLLRIRSVYHRLASYPPDQTADELEHIKAFYEQVWMRHNKRENIEVSLGVFDRVIAAYREGWSATEERPGWLCLDLRDQYNYSEPEMWGAPIGCTEVNDIPFVFAPRSKTHVVLTPEAPDLTVSFASCDVRDIHLMAGSPRISDEPYPALKVQLLNGGDVMFEEMLDGITHVCDTFAPLGESNWAGGGFVYVDRRRVRYGVPLAFNHAVMEVHAFPMEEPVVCDALRFTAADGVTVQIFAVTLEPEVL